ncbi:MAG: malectin domain-containing carbohydrate-binding protein [Leeuwenhoekiella sp.]
MKKITQLQVLLFVLLGLFSTITQARDYYVSALTGNDRNNGQAQSSPFQTIQRMSLVSLNPGDNIYFMNGTYRRSGTTLWTIRDSGAPGQYITIQNFPGHKPLFEFDSWVAFDIVNGASYLKFSGLTIKGTRSRITQSEAANQPGSCANNKLGNPVGYYNGIGIQAVGNNLTWASVETTGNEIPHHLIIDNCEIYDCTGSALGLQEADYLTVTNNKLYNNGWYTIFGTSAINMYQLVNIDGTTDIHNVVRNNLLYGNGMKIPQVPECKFYDGNAVIVDDLKHQQTFNNKIPFKYPSYSAKTLIMNNVIVNNGGSGLHFYLSENVMAYNNTVYGNAFQNGGDNANADLRIGAANNIDVRNNIFVGTANTHRIDKDNVNVKFSHNYSSGSVVYGPYLPPECSTCLTGPLNFLNMDVNNSNPFITASGGKLEDVGTSIPLVTNDYLGNARPHGAGYDIGAYEIDGTTCSEAVYYADQDGDGLGDPNESISACTQPEGYVTNSGDLCPQNPAKSDPGSCGCAIDTSSGALMRINVGGSAINNAGKTYSADIYSIGGIVSQSNADIAGTDNDSFYQSQRYSNADLSSFSYSIPVPNGTYDVVLHFAETFFGSAGNRVFDIFAENASVIDNLDIYGEVGKNTALSYTTSVLIVDGFLNLDFTPSANRSTLAGIEILFQADCSDDPCTEVTWYEDTDGDGAGDPASTIDACDQPEGYVAVAGDACIADSAKTAPGDCGCGVEESPGCGCTEVTWYEDTDGDGAGDPASTIDACDQPDGYVAVAGDACIADSAKTEPGDCGCGVEDSPGCGCVETTWYEDTDGDGAGDPASTIEACNQPPGYVAIAGDLCPVNGSKTVPDECGCDVITTANSALMRINAGGNAATWNGQSFSADVYFSGGQSASSGASIDGTPDDAIYKSERFSISDLGSFDYNIPIDNGTYTVVLHFAEIYWNGAGQRIFEVVAEDVNVVSNYDMVAAVGPKTADTKEFSVNISDGELNMSFIALVNRPKLSAIEIFTATGSCEEECIEVEWYADADGDGAGDATDVVLACEQPDGYVDNTNDQCPINPDKTVPNACGCDTESTSGGGIPPFSYSLNINSGGNSIGGYEEDQFFNAGLQASTSAAIAGTTNDVLYQSERFSRSDGGSFGYDIPLENGEYEVTLHFAEIYWNESDQRIFAVNLEGDLVIPSLDLVAEVGSKTAYKRTFTLEISDGELNVVLLAIKNRPTIAGVQVKQTNGSACISDSNTVPYDVSTENQDSFGSPSASSIKELSVYPTIVRDVFTVLSPVEAKMDVIDASGRQLKFLELNPGENVLNIGDLPSGIYLLNISTDSGDIIRKKVVRSN